MKSVECNIFLDTETLPAQDEDLRKELLAPFLQAAEARSSAIDEEIAAIKPPANFKDPEKIVRWEAEERPKKVQKLKDEQTTLDHNARQQGETAWRKTSFDGALGHLCVIGFAINESPPVTLWTPDYRDRAQEADILRKFFEVVDKLCTTGSVQRIPTFIGHNVLGFDLRFIYQRAVVLGVKPSRYIPFDAKPWDDCIFDTMSRWTGSRDLVGLDKLCRVLGVESKGTEIGEDIDGSMVWDFVRDGRIEEVAAYCAGDVHRARELWRRMTFTPAPEAQKEREAA